MGLLRLILRVPTVLLWNFLLFWPVLLLWAVKLDKARGRLVSFYYAVNGWIVGLRVTAEGAISTERPLMLVANHTSYLDVWVLGGRTAMSFMPKREVRSWPVVGFFCVLADCIFVERKRSELDAARAETAKRLARGKVVCLFPEGTTGDGIHLKPFKSGFFSLAEEFGMPVQPATVAYTHIGREPIPQARRAEVAWIGEATFFGHVLHVLTLPSIRVHVVFHPPIWLKDFADRKELAHASEDRIRATLDATLERNRAR